MSQDPNAFSESRGYAGGGDLPDPAYPPIGDLRRREAVERVRLPATFLLVSGGLNLLGCLYWLVNAFFLTMTPVDQLQKSQAPLYKQMGMTPPTGTPQEHTLQVIMAWGFLLGGILATALPLLAGARMLVMRNYALCIVGAIVTAIPCLSCPSGTCLIVGQVAGIWAVVVLMSEDVRPFFR